MAAARSDAGATLPGVRMMELKLASLVEPQDAVAPVSAPEPTPYEAPSVDEDANEDPLE